MKSIEQLLKEKIILSSDEIHVFLYKISLFNSNELIHTLSDDERTRADKLKIKQKQDQFIVTRSLLRLLLSNSLTKEPNDIVFTYEQHGKPIIKDQVNNKPIEFNVSHSGDYALIAMTLENRVGVDIETINTRTEYESLSNRFFSEKEKDELFNVEKLEQCDAFYRIWARKESFIKAVGQGVSFGLDRFSVPVDETMENGQEITTSAELDDKWFCYDLMKLDDYKLALTTSSNKIKILLFTSK